MPAQDAGRLQHLEVEGAALFQPLRLEQLALGVKLLEPQGQLGPDALDRLLQRRARGDVVRVGIDADLVEACRSCAPVSGSNSVIAFQLLAEEGKPPGAVFEVGGPEIERVAPDPEGAALEGGVVAAVLLGDQVGDDLALVVGSPTDQVLGHRRIGLDRADAVDAGDRGDDDHVVAFQQRPGRRVAHPVDLLVDLAIPSRCRCRCARRRPRAGSSRSS